MTTPSPERALGNGGALVLDASAVIARVTGEAAAREVSRLLATAVSGATRLVVPPFFWLELVNVLARRYHLPSGELMERVIELDALGVETIPQERPELLLVIDLVERHGLSAYDAGYLALAHTIDARFVTADRRLAAAAGDRAILLGAPGEVREVAADYETPGWVTWPSLEAYLEGMRQRVYRWAEESGGRL